MSERKFYKTTLKVVVVSEEPLEWDDLSDVHYSIMDGGCSGKVTETGRRTLTGRQAAKVLSEQGSEPGFFRLDEKGKDLE